MRERDAEKPEEKHQVLEWEYFLRALVRIACLGQAQLGGQKKGALEKKMEEENAKKEADKERKDKARKKFERAERRFKKYENQDLDPHDSDLDREEEKGATGIEGLYNKGRKKARHKRIFFSDKD